MEENFRALKILIQKLNTWVAKIKPSDNLCKSEDYIETIENIIMDIEEKIEDIDYEFEDNEEFSSQRQLISKFFDYKNSFEDIKAFFNKKKEQVRAEHEQEILTRKEQYKDSINNDVLATIYNSISKLKSKENELIE